MVLSQSVELYNDSEFKNRSIFHTIQEAHLSYFPSCVLPPYIITLWLYFASLNCIKQYFPISAAAPINNIIFRPKSINLKADNSKSFNKFWLYGKQYMQYRALAKKPKNTKQKILLIWLWRQGEDIFPKELDGNIMFYYYQLYKKQKQL